MSALKIFDGGDAPPPDAPQERPAINGFAAIPHALCASPVSHLGYRVFGAILSFTRGADSTTVTDATIANMIGVGRQAASRAVAELVAIGVLTKRSAGPLRTLTLNPSPTGSVVHGRHKLEDDDTARVAQTGRLCRSDGALVSPRRGACVAQTGHLLRREEKTSEKGRASSGEPRKRAPPTPVKKGAPPRRAAPPPPADEPFDPAKAFLSPEALVSTEALFKGNGPGTEGRWVAAGMLGDHRRAVAYYQSRGECPPRPSAESRAEWRSHLAACGLPLPVGFVEMPPGDDRSEKGTGPGSLGKDAPGPAWTDHP